jgi:hypothetical protein
MNKDLLKHMVVLVQIQLTMEMRDKMHVQGWDMLSTHDQDGLHLLTFAARGSFLELELENRFL